MAAITVMT